MPKLPLRIAILEADTPLPGTLAKYGGYGGVFTSLLHRAADSFPSGEGGLQGRGKDGLELKAYDVVTLQNYPDLETIDAVLITGSKYNAFENDAWIVRLVDFVRLVLAQRRVRVVGVCFGHQIVGRALGAPVARSHVGWEASVTSVELNEKGKAVFGLERLAIYQMHRDIVESVPAGVENVAYTDKCKVQAMYEKGRLITVQGHPEFTEDIVREILKLRHETGLFTDEMYEGFVSRVADEQDGVQIARAFLTFLMEE